ncbi:hypothetical protein BLNAU_2496 [Blattamonas nauphoetae]|uniref:HMG box domain-containing protein n=1 Tax=Blattamonas nauphoetae TaxID=2049346 RepID=A0ABQ9YG35_9EUKA|nr:hypothetical protein BLNAU_2496 [Blattamonas nauphoetae]
MTAPPGIALKDIPHLSDAIQSDDNAFDVWLITSLLIGHTMPLKSAQNFLLDWNGITQLIDEALIATKMEELHEYSVRQLNQFFRLKNPGTIIEQRQRIFAFLQSPQKSMIDIEDEAPIEKPVFARRPKSQIVQPRKIHAFYLQANRRQIKQELTESLGRVPTLGEIQHEGVLRLKTLSEEEKKPFRDLVAQDLLRYQNELIRGEALSKVKAKATSDDSVSVQALSSDSTGSDRPQKASSTKQKTHSKDDTSKKHRRTTNKIPVKAPLSAYNFFFQREHPKCRILIREETKTEPPTHAVTRMVADKWLKLTPEQRAPDEERAAKDKERFAKELEAWETKQREQEKEKEG